MVKKFFSGILTTLTLLVVLSVSCFAQTASTEDISAWLEPMLGDWYSTKGNLAMSVQNGQINGCAILGGENLGMVYPTSGTLQIAEANQNRSMKLEVFGNDSHQYMIVDDKLALRRSVREEHFESMGGIYLGMTEEDLLHYYGKPDSKTADGDRVRWEYTKDKFAVIFKSNIVVGVRIYQGSSRHFDRSGLGSADSPEVYAQKYGMAEVPVIPAKAGAASAHTSIGHGEYMYFTSDYVQLSVYDSWLYN